MSIHSLKAITPIDGRYASKTSSLISYFSEEALIKYRVQVEIEYFIALVELKLPQLSSFDIALFTKLRTIYTNFSTDDAQNIKNIEKVTNQMLKRLNILLKKNLML